MALDPTRRRPIGTMVVYGYPDLVLADDLDIARRLHASTLEILPFWKAMPDPAALAVQVADAGLTVHSAHGCWGGVSIQAARVDLGSPDDETRRQSVDDIARCADWLARAGGRYLVVHPGGLSYPEDAETRRAALGESLTSLVALSKGSGVVFCVENMPPGVHPGSRMADLRSLVDELDLDGVALALDTGHAHIASTPRAETLAAGPRLVTTHVHDNDGRQDTHLPPGLGTLDWEDWVGALNAIDYRGPIMLECVRYLRRNPEFLTTALLDRLDQLSRGDAIGAVSLL